MVTFDKVLKERKCCKYEGGVEVSHCEEVEREGVGEEDGGREGKGEWGRMPRNGRGGGAE